MEGDDRLAAVSVRNFIIRFIAVFFSLLVAAGSFTCFFAAPVHAETKTPGQDLEIRVGYFGDDMDYRTKAVLSRSQIEGLGMETRYYSNLTNVGTVMGLIAKGPRIADVITAAGIDLGSVQMIHLRTTDGQSGNEWFANGSLNMDQWINSTRYYYPELRANYEITDDGLTLPKEGSLAHAQTVPAILAVLSAETKNPRKELDESMLSNSKSYRFCAGQSALEEGVPSNAVSSMNSAYWVFGIDVQLYGSPSTVTGITLNPEKNKVKVGSKMKINVTLSGQELFEDKVEGNLKWKSSDPSIATVDENGIVTFKKKGKVTITVTDLDSGISKSVTVRGVSKDQQEEEQNQDKDDPEKDKPQKDKDKKENKAKDKEEQAQPEKQIKDKSKKKTGSARLDTTGLHEVVIGGTMFDRKETDQKVKALDAQGDDPNAPLYAGIGAGVCIGAGGLARLLMYLKEVK